jgi:glycosyltransferase involved in cell wall biosynthesis
MFSGHLTTRRLEGHYDGFVGGLLLGWVYDIDCPNSPVLVTIVVNGRLHGSFAADLHRVDLEEAGKGRGGCCGFAIAFDPWTEMAKRRAASLTIDIFVLDGRRRALGAQRFPREEATSFDVAPENPSRWVAGLRRTLFHKRKTVLAPALSAHLPAAAETHHLAPATASASTAPTAAPAVAHEAPATERKTVVLEKSAFRYRIVGHLDDHYSLSVVNRGLALALRDICDGNVAIYHFHGGPVPGPLARVPEAERQPLSEMTRNWDELDASDSVSICHHYPPIKDERPSRLRLAMFFWEESLVPKHIVEHFNTHFDGLLVTSSFVAGAVRFSGCVLPIKVVPLGVDSILDLAKAAPRRAAGASANGVPLRFLHVSSVFRRKGTDVLVRSYFEEFSGADDVELYIKTFANPHNDIADQIHQLQSEHANPPRVILDQEFKTERELVDLYLSAHAIVLPTRGEGFNLPAAEAMALGVPVIATGYSAHADFLTEKTGWPIDYRLTPAQGHLSASESLWAEPNPVHLRAIMRDFEFLHRGSSNNASTTGADRHSVSRKVDRAHLLIRDHYTWSNCALMVDRFAADLLSSCRTPSPARLKVAWISSWDVPCGIAEYSQYLTDQMDLSRVEFVYICDRRTRKRSRTVYPLYNVSSTETLADVHDFLNATAVDAIVVQHQPTFFPIVGDAAARLADLQSTCPVFLFMHSVKFLSTLDAKTTASTVEYLRKLQGIFVHTVEDVNLLKEMGLVKNVVYFPHGVGRVPAREDDGRDRHTIASMIVDLDARSLEPTQRKALLHNLTTARWLLGTFGFLLPHKRNMELLKALYLLHAAGLTDVCMVFVCASLDQRSLSEADRLLEMVEKLDLSDQIVIITEFLPLEDAQDILRSVHLLAFAYQDSAESASGAVRIALSTERPVITTPELIFDALGSIIHRAAGWEAEQIADAMAELLRDPALLESKTAQQSAWLDQNSWATLGQRLTNILVGSSADYWLQRRSR